MALITNRSQDYVGFIDSGLWREDHGDHLHDFKQGPAMSQYELAGCRPTHIITHDGQLAVFFDGDAETGMPSSVQVVTDTDISSQTSAIPTLNYSINMHGVTEPRGDYLFASFRRDDAESSSATKILPDQIGVYHLHDGEYELEAVLGVTCPDLHGAVQNDDFVIFGCSDGAVVVHQHNSTYEVEKIPNADDLGSLRIGTIYGREESSLFIGVAAGHGGGPAILLSINPEESEMETLEWQL